MNGRECGEATLEHLMWLLYPKFAHLAFTTPAFRIVKGRSAGHCMMSLNHAHVLLIFLWLAVTLFGPCLPILHALIALLANVYYVVLFGTNAQVLDVREIKENVASLP
eukprot:2443509-Amphidinium_carterae.1